MNNINNIETTNDFIIQLLALVEADQWSGQYSDPEACHCCPPEYEACCPQCGELETADDHLPECERALLIKKVKAYLDVEDQIQNEK